jgi:phage shock protein A
MLISRAKRVVARRKSVDWHCREHGLEYAEQHAHKAGTQTALQAALHKWRKRQSQHAVA